MVIELLLNDFNNVRFAYSIEYIYVMAEARCFANTNHQSLTIEHLKYENELLLNRNHLLAEENSKLLHELEQALKRVESNETHRANRIADEQRRLFEKAKMDCETLFHGMDQKVERLVGGYVAAYRDSLSQNCSIWQLYDCLSSIVSKLLEEKSDVREGQLRELISHTEGRLTLRRQARDKT
jgi:cell division septum initiation protein DivIVA